MVDTYLLRSLKRVHDECERSLQDENASVNQSLAKRFNDVLEDFQSEYPNEERIQNVTEATGVSVNGRMAARYRPVAIDEMQDIKLKTLKIADALDLDTEDFEELSQNDEFAVINVNQQQTQEQSQSQVQRVTIDQIIEDVDRMMIDPDVQEELKELIREYEAELEDEETDPSRLREISGKVKDYSDDAARKLVMLATERGVDVLGGLSI